MTYRVISLQKGKRGYTKIVLASDLGLSEAQEFLRRELSTNSSGMLTIELQ